MMWIILLSFHLTVFLVFAELFDLFMFSNRRIEKRIRYYLKAHSQKPLPRKKFNLLVQMQLYNQKLRNQMSFAKDNEKLEQILQRAGIPLKPEEYILFQWMATLLMGGVLYLISGKVFFFLVGGTLGFATPRWWVRQKQQKRMVKFNNGLPDMITIIIGSLRAGFSFPQALKSVVEESDAPVREEIELVLKELQYGNSIEDALHHLYERMPSGDLELMIQAILIQRQVGGNLATVLDTIVNTIRERNAIQRQVLTLTAQGRLSGTIIGLLPIVLGLFIYLMSPDYIGTLFTHSIGIILLGVGIFFGIIGFIFVRKLTRIEV